MSRRCRLDRLAPVLHTVVGDDDLALQHVDRHHGQSPSLNDLFSNSAWGFHTNAGNANFSVTLAGAGKVDDLVAFLLSIDASTPEIDVPTDPGTGASFDACPATF